MELQLKRFDLTDERTIGSLYVDGVEECFILEDTVRAPGVKVDKKTAIPAGRYRVVVTYSPRFRKLLPLLLSVPGFSGIRMHSGNLPEDTDGCLIVGQKHTRHEVLASVKALDALLPKIQEGDSNGREVWITITNPEPA